MKKTCTSFLKVSACACLALGVAANTVHAATSLYFDVNGATAGSGVVNAGSYSWDSANWSTSSGLAVATGNWVAGDFPRFTGGGSGISYTVTANASESMAGLYQTVAGTLNIAAAGSGALNVTTTGATLVTGVGNVQGFLATGTVNITAPITGSGGVDPQNGGTINMFGVNTYSGGTALTSSSTLVYFNNNSSFGTAPIGIDLTSSYAPLLSSGGSTITLNNNIVAVVSGGGINFANSASTPVIAKGTVSLGANVVNLRNNGNSTAPLTFSGVISGTTGGNVAFSGANGGTIILNAANTYTGTTTVGVAAATAITLKLNVSHAIDNTSSLIMAGGTLNLDPGGNVQNVAGTLGLTASSVIDFGGVAGTLTLGNSSGNTWTGTLSVNNYNPNIDILKVGTSSSGLTSGQLSDIVIDGGAIGAASIDSFGDVVLVPEPTSLALGALGGLGMLWMVKRRKA